MAGAETKTRASSGNEPSARPYAGDTLAVRLLEDGGQRTLEVAGWLAEFVGAATRSLDIAVYDCCLSDGPAVLLRRMLAGRIAAGVRARLVYDAGARPRTPAEFALRGVEPAPPIDHEQIAELGLPRRAVKQISGPDAVMHHSYVIRDGESVWAGSLNPSDDAMQRMENIVLMLDSPAIARHFTRDFVQLWGTGRVVASAAATAPVVLRYGGMPALVRVDFSPGRGQAIDALVADRVSGARHRVVICSPLPTGDRLLAVLARLIERGEVAVEGVYDGSLMASVLAEWRSRPDLAGQVAAVQRVLASRRFVGKASLPYRPDATRNFLQIKALVVDDTVLTGSYGFSHAAEANAEHLLTIESPALADRLVGYARRLQERYRTPAATSG